MRVLVQFVVAFHAQRGSRVYRPRQARKRRQHQQDAPLHGH